MLTTLEKADFLQRAGIFAQIPTESLLRIAAISAEAQLTDRQMLFTANGPADAMFVILGGEIALARPGKEEKRLARFEVAGALAVLAGKTYTETAAARGEASLLAIGREDFFEAMAEDFEITRGILRQLVDMLSS